MGIRYYAYAFEGHQTEQALADPRAFIGADPLADAWGFEPGARVATVSFEQAVPERDLLYLDKAWRELQLLTRPDSPSGRPRPAYRMFEGQVQMCGDGWIPWVRALSPAELIDVADDVADLADELHADSFADRDYVLDFLQRARRFVTDLAAEGRGMAYLIG